MNGPLGGRAAVVTGASRGIGLAIARELVRAGARVAMLARGAQALAARAAELGATAHAVPCDVRDADAVARAAAAITSAFAAPPDILVNNAGVFRPAPLDRTTPEDFADTLRVNLVAPFTLMHAFLAGMRARGSGHIVTIGSVSDRVIFAENASYSASKFGLRALHEVTRTELRGTGVRATLVSPSSTDTGIWDDRAGTGRFPPRSAMLPADAVAAAVLFAVTQPARVNVDELRLSTS